MFHLKRENIAVRKDIKPILVSDINEHRLSREYLDRLCFRPKQLVFRQLHIAPVEDGLKVQPMNRHLPDGPERIKCADLLDADVVPGVLIAELAGNFDTIDADSESLERMFTLSGHALPGAKWLLVQGLFAVTAASGA